MDDVSSWRLSSEGGVPIRTLGLKGGGDWEVPHRLEKGMSASEDTGPENCEIPHRLRWRTKHSFLGCGNLYLLDAF